MVSGTSNTFFDVAMAEEVITYLQAGGKVYLEGGDALGYDQRLNTTLLNLFGLASVSDGTTNVIDGLSGQAGTITAGMSFTSSTQTNNDYIDLFPTVTATGKVAFIESPYGNVAVQNTGATYGQKTFCFSYALAGLTDGTSPSTKNDLMAAILNFFDLPLKVSAKIFLEGAYAGSSTMSTDLNSILPTTDTYSLGETVSSIPEADIVDWVEVELRSSTTTVEATKAAFLKSDGSIVDLDGKSSLKFYGLSGGDYYIAIFHRNHLAVMSASAVTLSNTTSTYNFTTGSGQFFGGSSGAVLLETVGLDEVWGMVSGDGNGNGQVQNNDSENIWKPDNGTSGYKSSDFNLNGQVQNNDNETYWKPNNGKGSQVPVPGP